MQSYVYNIGNIQLDDQRIIVAGTPVRVALEEMQGVCKALKNKKSPGPGDIPIEMFKYGTE